MRISLTDIKPLRKKLGMTQSTLAGIAGVSQSLLAKIEAGRIDPSYSKAQTIIDALYGQITQADVKAKDIMVAQVLSISPKDRLEKIIPLMQKHGISQLPVMHQKTLVGMLSESSIVEALLKKPAKKLIVHHIMQNPPPLIGESTPQATLLSLLSHYPFLLVQEKGKIKGIVTKADLLKRLYH